MSALAIDERSAVATEFREMLATLGVAQHHFAHLCSVSPRCVRRWQSGDRRTPHGVGILLHLLHVGKIGIADIEQAAASARAQNGSAQRQSHEPEQPEPAPEPPAPKPAKAVVRADQVENIPHQSAPPPDAPTLSATPLTAAEAVFALPRGACRWPENDPQNLGFGFCGDRTLEGKPYCQCHCAIAYRPAEPLRGMREAIERTASDDEEHPVLRQDVRPLAVDAAGEIAAA